MTTSFPGSHSMPNMARRQAIVWWAISAAMIIGIFLPGFLPAGAADWVFGLSFLCIVFGITSVVVAVMYTKRARLVGRMLNEDNLLAHWKYAPAEWEAYARKEYVQNRKEKRNAFLLVSGISVIAGLVLILAHPDGVVIFAFTILGIIVMMGCAAFLAVWFRGRQNRAHLGETHISADGVYLNRELHVWRGMGAALEQVDYPLGPGSGPSLEITYSVPNRFNRQFVTVRVPVPRGSEEQASSIAAELRHQIDPEPAGRVGRADRKRAVNTPGT